MSLIDTIALATLLHDGVTDRAGVAYIQHPLWVMAALPAAASDDDRCLAVLHDTVEDCKPRLRELMAREMAISVADNDVEGFFDFYRHRGYSPYLIEGLRLVTRDLWMHLTYLEWIQMIANSGHRGAILVKYFDNRHNSDPDRIARVLPAERASVVGMQHRYERSKRILEKAMGI